MKNEIEKLIIEWNKKIGKKSPDIIGYDLIELCSYVYNKAFALGRKDMLEEVKKEIDNIENILNPVVGRAVYDGEWININELKQRLENLNSPQKSEEADKCLLGDTSLEMDRAHSVDTNFDDFVKELKDKTSFSHIACCEDCGADQTILDVINELADKYRKRGKKLCQN